MPQVNRPMERRLVLLTVATCLGNFFVFIVALAPAARFNEPWRALLALLGSYALVGAASRLWSRTLLMTVLPAAAALPFTLGVLKWSMHLTDTGGEFSYSVWQYMLPTSVAEAAGLVAAVTLAGFGWIALDRVVRRSRPVAQGAT